MKYRIIKAVELVFTIHHLNHYNELIILVNQLFRYHNNKMTISLLLNVIISLNYDNNLGSMVSHNMSLSDVPDYFGRNKISSGGDLSHYSSASLY